MKRIISAMLLLFTLFIIDGCKKDNSDPESNPPIPSSGYIITKNLITTDLPCFVNIMFQVSDMEGNGITDLVTEDFDVLEDNETISPTESAMAINKRDEISYNLKTVLMLDNSASVGSNIQEIKNAAITLINNMVDQQEIALYVFSEEPLLIQDFTSDKNSLISAISTITLGYATTNLYGSIVTGASRWQDDYSISSIEQGFLIIITDGSDTQGSTTLSSALGAIGNKKVYTVGLGEEQDPDALEQLGTAGYFSLMDYSQLTLQFNNIQEEMKNYANSFYWLFYLSPKRGDNSHSLKLQIRNNVNTSSNGYITGNFNSDGFYSVLPGISINQGITDIQIISGESKTLKATTYFGDHTPNYSWFSSNTNLLSIHLDTSDNSEAIIYAAPDLGNQEVFLTISDLANNFTANIPVHITNDPSPIASFSANPTEGSVPLHVQFTDNSSNSPQTWEWSFGDGASSNDQNPSHIYSTVGKYTVSLTVSNEFGLNTANYVDHISVADQAPVAEFTANNTSGYAPLTVIFTDQSENNPTQWNWDFGNGSSDLQNPTHVYSVPGTYTVSLTATNIMGSDTKVKSGYINVEAAPAAPVAGFSGTPGSGTAPLQVHFTDESINDPDEWQWAFGDGTYSFDQHPVHTYTEAGSYTVTLMVSNAQGNDTEVKNDYITVGGLVTENLIAHYPFSGNADDHSGYGFDGYVYDATLTNDRHDVANSAYFFDGVGDYIQVPDDVMFRAADAKPFTWCFWMSPYSTNHVIIFKGTNGSNGALFDWWVDYTADNKVRFRYTTSDYSFQSHYETIPNIPLNEWSFITISYEFGNSNSMRIYMNGIAVPGEWVMGDGNHEPYSSSSSIYIGRHHRYDGTPVPYDYFNGKIDDIRIYNSILSTDEVMDLYLETK